MDGKLQILLTARDGKRYDLSRIYQSLSWSGSSSRCYREVSVNVLIPNGDNIPNYTSALGDTVQLIVDGTQVFLGAVVTRQCSTDGHTMTLTCKDRGWQLSGNEGWYSFACAAEQATRALCSDFGIPVGSLALTGIAVTRKFPGVALHRIVGTMYTKAAEQNGRRYSIRFDGSGRLCVTEKPTTASMTLAPKVNLVSSALTEDVSNLCTQVAIYSDDGALIRTLEDTVARRIYGLFQHVLTQKDGDDAAAEAKAWLSDNREVQTVTVECLGDVRLTSGTAVYLRTNSSGAVGLFWIESDTHTWKNGQYICRLSLNFRNLMEMTNAGQEVTSKSGSVDDDDWAWLKKTR